MKLLLLASALVCARAAASGLPSTAQDDGALPNITGWTRPERETRPWTRWWWLGSAVDETNLTLMLTQFRDAGIGGVEICPIYGAKGYEDRFLDFLSPRWIRMFAYTVREARRLGLGVDLTTGTGWPFGGPEVAAADASARIHLQTFDASTSAVSHAKLPKGTLQCLAAVSADGRQFDLRDLARNGEWNWSPPAGRWRVYALTAESPIQRVKRAAPGGQGNVLNPYSIAALDRYLAVFSQALANYPDTRPRCFFKDSFEYQDADWAADFFNEFQRRRGYDLRAQLPALAGEGDPDLVARVRHDFHETLSDLHIDFIARWTAWAHSRGSLTREQAHGAPANLVDAYAAADIPETEIFGGLAGQNVLMNKFASSAAHLRGHRLSSAESFTWLTEHFQATPAQVKSAADALFLTGVNHAFFHGIPYSPSTAPWPGWQFYAAINFGPEGGLWPDLPYLNAYLTRCQSILQAGAPANDVLLYFPVHDFWESPGNLFLPFTVEQASRWLGANPIQPVANLLWNRGYGYDVLSDRILAQAVVDSGQIILNGNRYGVVLVPPSEFMPESTFANLVDLARNGATILVDKALPADVPGLGNLVERRAELDRLKRQLVFATDTDAVRRAAVGRGCFLVGTNLEAMLAAAGVRREPCVDFGLRFVRRAHSGGYHYFLANRSEKAVDGWVPLGTRAESAILLDPRFADRTGRAALDNKNGATRVYLQLQPGESIVLRTFVATNPPVSSWTYDRPAGPARQILGPWQVRFIDGGPVLPAGFETRQLASWTSRNDPELHRFAGTARYTTQFQMPSKAAGNWLLDLGRVCESARVILNGRPVGALWCPSFQLAVGHFLKPGTNLLEIEVTNLAANRVRDLDRRKVYWKYFYDLNLVGRDYRPLDAANWPLRDSGLIGPVTLQPVESPPGLDGPGS
jgi:hypothetical protein